MCTVERKANDILGYVINLRSPLQLRQLIFDKLELDKNIRLPNSLKWSKSNQQSKTTSEEMLNCLRGTHPIIEIILIHRKVILNLNLITFYLNYILFIKLLVQLQQDRYPHGPTKNSACKRQVSFLFQGTIFGLTGHLVGFVFIAQI